MLLEYLSEMLIRGAAYAFALQRDEDCFAGVGGEEVVAYLHYWRKVLWAGEADREGAVHEVEVFLRSVGGVNGLEPDVEEANAVLELSLQIDDLTANGW